MNTQSQMTHADWLGATVYDRTGDKIGDITDIYFDDVTGQPEWLTVSTGWFGTKEQFVPIAGSRGSDDGLIVDYTTTHIKDAPSIDTNEMHLGAAEERRLYDHYGLNFDGADHESAYGGRERADEGYEYDDKRGAGAFSAAVTRSEEELAVEKVPREAGRVRLHKYVVTDDVEITVPVKRQVARIVRTPAASTTGAAIEGETVEEIVLTEEQIVVNKNVVAKETVSIETETFVTEHTVAETVRKEKVVIDGDVEPA